MTKEYIAKNIAGEIALASEWHLTFRKWREIFGISQTELARKMGIAPSVVSDYESGRRKSPGIGFVKKIVEAMIDIDYGRGGSVIKRLMISPKNEAIIELREFSNPIDGKFMVETVKGKIVANEDMSDRRLRGYTMIDSIKAILELSDFSQIYGSTTERALIFTKVKMGRSPMIALKVTQPKPSMVVLHGLAPKEVDKLAIRIAKMEKIPLVVSTLNSEDELIERLRGIGA